jgi:tetratricopeptide (TPR) repeat protein
MAWNLRYLGHVWLTPWQTIAVYRKVLAMFEEVGDERGTVETLYRLGVVTAQMGDYPEAQHYYQNSLTRSRKLGRREVIMFCLTELGYIEWACGNYQAAEERCQESLTLSKEIGYPSYEATTLRYLGRIAAGLGNFQNARRNLQKSIAIHEEIGLQGMKAEGLGELASVIVLEQNFAEARQLAQDSLALCQELEHRVGEIAPHTVLGEAALGLGNFEAAEEHFHHALQIAGEVWQPSLALHAMVGLAQLHAAVGDKVRAYETATFVLHHPASWQWSKDRVASLAAQLETELPADLIEAVQTHNKEKNLEEVIGKLTKVAV